MLHIWWIKPILGRKFIDFLFLIFTFKFFKFSCIFYLFWIEWPNFIFSVIVSSLNLGFIWKKNVGINAFFVAKFFLIL